MTSYQIEMRADPRFAWFVVATGPYAACKAELETFRRKHRHSGHEFRMMEVVSNFTELKTPEEWQALDDVEIMDPDGWRDPDGRGWADPISWVEYTDRRTSSTCQGRHREADPV